MPGERPCHFLPLLVLLSKDDSQNPQIPFSPRGELCAPSPADVFCPLSPVAVDLPTSYAFASPQLEEMHQDGGAPVPTSQEFYLGEFSAAAPSLTFDDIVFKCGLSEGQFLTVIVVSLPFLLFPCRCSFKV